ncbi:MAG TPA: hypothetical protein VLL52_02610 [Anaerolineae bacterium]|nr:hypothetical protein [Anaerolineae bacterium]
MSEQPLNDHNSAEQARARMNQNARQATGGGGPRSNLLIPGIIVVVLLVIVALFLPPISLGQYLFDSPEEETSAETEEPETALESNLAIPGELSLALSDSNAIANVARIEAADFTNNNNVPEALQPAVTALPADMSLQSPVYAITFDGANQGELTVTPPNNNPLADLYHWDGQAWQFTPAMPTGSELKTNAGELGAAYAFMQLTAQAPALSAELLPTQNFAADIPNLLNEVIVGTLTLSGGNGDLVGTTNPVAGAKSQIVRVTNTGAIVDQASITAFLGDATAQSRQIDSLVQTVRNQGFNGVVVDYQGITGAQRAAYTQYITQLSEALSNNNLTLGVVFNTPLKTPTGSWDTGGQDWTAIGAVADIVYIQTPLNPNAYADDGAAQQLLSYATRLVDRQKLAMLVTANAIDAIGDVYWEIQPQQVVNHFGAIQFEGDTNVEPGTNVTVNLAGNASPLAWQPGSLSYQYTYENMQQSHNVWLSNAAALNHRMRLAKSNNLRGAAVRGLGNVANDANYTVALNSFLGNGDAPQPVATAITWVVTDNEGGVLASTAGEDLVFNWQAADNEGDYTITAGIAQGNQTFNIDSLAVAVATADVVEVVEPDGEDAQVADDTADEEATEEEATEEETEEETEDTVTHSTGVSNATVSVGANIRQGPGLIFGTFAGGLTANSRVEAIGRNEATDWIQIIFTNDSTQGQETEGWIYANLLTLDSTVVASNLPVVEVDTPVVSNPGGGGGGSAPPPPPIGNGSFELGGQTHSLAHPAQMRYAGMTWVKFQHKWSVGDTPEAVAGRIQQAHNNGFKVLLSIPGSDHSSINYDAYIQFLGGVAALGPDAIEVWNEMNLTREWPSGQINPATYVNNMLKPAYTAIKAANPNVMVISGALAPTGFFGGCGGGGCDDLPYTEGMVAAGALSYMDCLGVHYNEGIIPPSQQSGDPRSEHYTRYFWGMVNTYWNITGGKQQCYTELGYLTSDGYPGLPSAFGWAAGTSVGEHAAWLAEAASLAGNSGKIRMMIVFSVDIFHYSEDPQGGYAMVRPDGSCPACETLHQVTGGR